MKISNLILPLIIAITVWLIYYFYFAPTKELGSFENFDTGSEINQEINVKIIKDRGIEKTADGKIIAFLVSDRNNKIVKVVLHQPVDDEILKSDVVELLGHMHETNFTAKRISVND